MAPSQVSSGCRISNKSGVNRDRVGACEEAVADPPRRLVRSLAAAPTSPRRNPIALEILWFSASAWRADVLVGAVVRHSGVQPAMGCAAAPVILIRTAVLRPASPGAPGSPDRRLPQGFVQRHGPYHEPACTVHRRLVGSCGSGSDVACEEALPDKRRYLVRSLAAANRIVVRPEPIGGLLVQLIYQGLSKNIKLPPKQAKPDSWLRGSTAGASDNAENSPDPRSSRSPFESPTWGT